MKTAAKFLALLAFPLIASCAGGGAPAGNGTLPLSGSSAHALGIRPAPMTTQTPPPGTTRFPTTWGRIAPFQVFDYYQQTGTSMSNSEIAADGYRYSSVWASFNPAQWHTSDPNTYISRYYLPEEDSIAISGHDLNWFKANHPDWIMYACDTNNNPTTYLAYSGTGFHDVVLDMHNPAVVSYEQQSLMAYMAANHYRAAALDQVVFGNIERGGNPNYGQKIIPGYYGCGVYSNGTFVRRYTSSHDPAFSSDIINWVKSARAAFNADPNHYAILVNHPVGSTSSSYDIALAQNVDMEMTEAGFADFGNYKLQAAAGVFGATVGWMRWLQSQNVAIGIIDKYSSDPGDLSLLQLEYSIGTYLMGNEQGAYLYTAGGNAPGIGYGAEQWHAEYNVNIGTPCSEMYGGKTYDPANPQIYYRRFTNGMVVVNSGSLPLQSETAKLPTNHSYIDLESRTVTNPLTVNSNDAYVLFTSVGTGCV